MLERIWDSFVCILIAAFLPVVSTYHNICQNQFLNVSVVEASGLESISNSLLIPFQFVFAGKIAQKDDQGNWKLQQRFDYQNYLAIKTAAAIITLPLSLCLGSFVKGLAFFSKSTQERYAEIQNACKSYKIISNNDFYKKIGISIADNNLIQTYPNQGYQRRPGDELHLQNAKNCLKDISKVLNDAQLLWWVDCGTLLGTIRYGGVIPWDEDIDVALLLPDFENARRAFNLLDSSKYEIQDWSGRDFPNTFMKIYVKETKDFIDIYFYDIKEDEKLLQYIFSLDHSIFFFDWWKERERRFAKPVEFSAVFPLKKSYFDSIEVFIPNDPVTFLQRYYGENLAPAKIYDPNTNRFEKDLTHPYWQTPNVH